MRLIYFFVLLSVMASRLPAQSCADLQSGEVRDLVAALDSAAAVGPVWSDYTIANHPIVLISQTRDTMAPACAAIWRHRKPLLLIPTNRGMRMSTPLYAMWNGDPVGPRPNPGNAGISSTLRQVPHEVAAALRKDGDTRAVVLPAPLRLDSLGNLGRALQAMKVAPVRMLVELAVHESYHLHSQIPTWLDQPRKYDWPGWDMQPDRRVLVERCYNQPGEVAELRRKELAALELAWRLLIGTRDIGAETSARAEARSFIAARRQRYALLEGVTVPSLPADPVTCERAEDVMELEEGAPQWIGYMTSVGAGLMLPSQAGTSAAESFYVSGMMQLWVLEQLIGGEAMRELTRAITRSQHHGGSDGAIFGRFEAIVGRLPASPR